MMIDDRDALILVYKAVAALAEKLTGESLTVRLVRETGEVIEVRGSGEGIAWCSLMDDRMAAASSQTAGLG